MLRVSQKLEYSMRAMIELALREYGGELVSAREIAESQQIPLRFLEQQLGTLHKTGLVESHRGAGGGCRLAKPADEIFMADIADAIEGAFYPMGCLEDWRAEPGLVAHLV
jgi:Rrf2 family protein